MGKSYLFNPFKINVFKTHSLKIFNLAQQNLTKLLCKNCAKQIKSVNGKIKCRKSVNLNVGFPTFFNETILEQKDSY